MLHYSLKPRTRKYVKGYGFLSFGRNLSGKCKKKLLDTAAKTGADALKSASKKLVHKTAEATGKFIKNKFADKFVKPKSASQANLRNVEIIVIPPEKREEI